jgi:hypothetical protein
MMLVEESMDVEWKLVEYRPGRYAKVSSEGKFLSMATREEVSSWFSSQQTKTNAASEAPDPVSRLLGRLRDAVSQPAGRQPRDPTPHTSYREGLGLPAPELKTPKATPQVPLSSDLQTVADESPNDIACRSDKPKLEHALHGKDSDESEPIANVPSPEEGLNRSGGAGALLKKSAGQGAPLGVGDAEVWDSLLDPSQHTQAIPSRSSAAETDKPAGRDSGVSESQAPDSGLPAGELQEEASPPEIQVELQVEQSPVKATQEALPAEEPVPPVESIAPDQPVQVGVIEADSHPEPPDHVGVQSEAQVRSIAATQDAKVADLDAGSPAGNLPIPGPEEIPVEPLEGATGELELLDESLESLEEAPALLAGQQGEAVDAPSRFGELPTYRVKSPIIRQPDHGDGELADEGPETDRWLWVDPRQEPGYSPGAFDIEAFFKRAVARFSAKQWSGGQQPARVAVHPGEGEDVLKPVAEVLGLEIVSDPLVPQGTYWLGLAAREGESDSPSFAE